MFNFLGGLMVFSFGKSKLEVRLGVCHLGLARETGSGFVSNCTMGLIRSRPQSSPEPPVPLAGER